MLFFDGCALFHTSPTVVAKCLAEANVCFCFAVRCHPAMKYAAGVRRQLAVRTIFNVLGPLTNPAGAKRQIMGVADEDITEKIATVLGSLGATRAMVVHAEDGLDEISITTPTKISEFAGGKVSTFWVQPEDFGMTRALMKDITVDSPQQSAEIIRGVLAGEKGPARDITVLNAAAALAVADKAADIAKGVKIAVKAIDSGAAAKALKKLVAVSNK
ncbi:MAG: Anthranilate phosphoribosyltransferase [Methanocella sp. PtaU1.Bin125]|nr:MAG: Anthranilate phosphoribosyltransferase [Methanocella sp. PtaU1.Bin125]